MAAELRNYASKLEHLLVGGCSDPTLHPNRSEVADKCTTDGHTIVAHYAWATLSSAAVTIIALPLLGLFDLANIVMLFLLTVVLVAIRWGRGPAIFSTVGNVVLFDFFCVPPRFSFEVGDVQYLVTFAVMLAVGLLTAHLTASLRFQAKIAACRESRAQALFEFASELTGMLSEEQICKAGTRALERAFGGQALILQPDAHDRIVVADANRSDLDLSLAQWVFERGSSTGFATDTLPKNAFRFLPLQAPVRCRGVVALRPAHRCWLLTPEQERQLATFCTLLATGLERVHFIEVAQRMTLHTQSEKMRASLLAGLSHDLRTPLTALIGLTDSLNASAPSLTTDQSELVTAIGEVLRRMGQLIDNLLEMTRLSQPKFAVKREWQAFEEVAGAAIHALKRARFHATITTHIARDLPLVEFDAVLIERVLTNLLENAMKFAGDEIPIELAGKIEGNTLIISVGDRGPGLPDQPSETLFDMFTRGQCESSTPGVGLGLAICRTIVTLHGGKIWASNRSGGGALFCFTLPLGVPPTVEHEVSALPALSPEVTHGGST